MKYTGTTTACSSAVYENANKYVGIGTIIPVARLDVFLNTSGTSESAGRFVMENTSTVAGNATIGLQGHVRSNSNAGTSTIYGVSGSAEALGNAQNVIGGRFFAFGSGNDHYGVNSQADGSTGSNYGVFGHTINASCTNNYAAYGYARNATNNYGMYGNAALGTNCYGVYAVASGGSSSNYGIYAAAPSGTSSSTNTAAFFNGDIYGTTAVFTTSDVNFKQNIQPLNNASILISQLNPKTYNFDHVNYPSFNLPSGSQFGLIAQDVEQVIPGMVKSFINPAQYDSLGNLIHAEVSFKAVSYETLIPILIAGFQEQQAKIDSLIAALNGAPRPVNSTTPQQRITLSDQQGIILQQNDPNPFAESTIIRFSIPETVSNARIMFSDLKGTVLKSAVIETRSEGSLEVFASDLSSGLYTYTLVCDGKVIDSKKMIKQ